MLCLILAFVQSASLPAADVYVSKILDPSQLHPVYRIPALCKAGNGDLLAFAEARREISDQSVNELVYRRLKKGTRDWSPLKVVVADPRAAINNPCVLVTRDAIWLTYQSYPNGFNERNASSDLNPQTSCSSFVISSRDYGQTWSKPVEISRVVKRPGMQSVAAGPGIGIELKKGRHAGRLVFPYNEGAKGSYTAFAVYSDDRGKTWKRGRSMPKPVGTNPNECQVVELVDGRLMMNCRDQGQSKLRLVSHSTDGGENWSEAALEKQLPDPTCQGSLVRLSWKPSVLLFSNPASRSKRVRGTLYISKDEGKSWTTLATLTGSDESFQYSSLCPVSDQEVAVLYESQEFNPNRAEGYRIKLASMKIGNLADLLNPADS